MMTYTRFDGKEYHLDGVPNHVAFKCPKCDGHFITAKVDETKTSEVIEVIRCGKFQVVRGEVGKV